MSEYTPSTTVTARGLSLFTDDNAKTNIKAITGVYLDIFQDIETAIYAVYQSRLLDKATGAQLDLLGSLVGRLRNDLNDVDYRTIIRAQILVNRSDGTSRAMTEILEAMTTDTSVKATYVDTSSFKFQVSFTGYNLSVDLMPIWKNMINQAKALGSGNDIVYNTSSAGSALVWCAVADANTTVSTWDDVADSTLKGRWSAVA